MLSTSGDTHLGGDDFDKRIVDFLADDFKQNEGIDLRKDRQALQRLTEAAEKAKMELSSVAQTSISLPFITATADGPKHIESQMSRAKFESICSDLLDRCRIPVEQALKDAKLKLSDLNEVSLLFPAAWLHASWLLCNLPGCAGVCVLHANCGSPQNIFCVICSTQPVCSFMPLPPWGFLCSSTHRVVQYPLHVNRSAC